MCEIERLAAIGVSWEEVRGVLHDMRDRDWTVSRARRGFWGIFEGLRDLK